jgi:hypothetical protein
MLDKKPWTEDEKKLVIEMHQTTSDEEIGKLIERSRSSVRSLRKNLHLVRTKKVIPYVYSAWSEDEVGLLEKFCNSLTYEEIKLYHLPNRTSTSIGLKARNLKLKTKSFSKNPPSVKWTDEEDQLLISSYGTLSYEDMSILFKNRTPAAIQGRVAYLGFDRDKKATSRKYKTKYEFNREFFSSPNIINSYVAGFIAADGWVVPKSHSVGITISALDSYLLEEIKHLIKSDKPLYYFSKGKFNYVKLELWGADKWIQDLKTHYNIVPRKSLILQPPNIIDDSLKRAFIRGYIDGDGWVGTTHNGYWIFGAAGTPYLLNWIRDYFRELVPIVRNYEPRVRATKSNIYAYAVSGKRAVAVLNKLAEVETPYLKRKWGPVLSGAINKPYTGTEQYSCKAKETSL